jgi:hypothetical protein
MLLLEKNIWTWPHVELRELGYTIVFLNDKGLHDILVNHMKMKKKKFQFLQGKGVAF